jgi:hypothetical protein
MSKSIKIKKPFVQKYTLEITSDMMAINAIMKSKVRMRFDFRVLAVYEDHFEAELLMLDNILLDCNNPLIREIAGINQAMGRMYQELHLLVAHDGTIISVLNTDLILQKWSETKAEMKKIAEQSEDLKPMFAINDTLFNSPEKLVKAVQGSEFFRIYFSNVYGKTLPYVKNNVQRPNFFNTILMNWELKVEHMRSVLDESMEIQTVAVPASKPGVSFSEEAYKQFAEQVDVKTLVAEMRETGSFTIDAFSGRLMKAVIHQTEKAAERLYSDMKYVFYADAAGERREPLVTVPQQEEKPQRLRRINFAD